MDFVEKKKSLVNYDPVDCTVLANEQVIHGKAERSGARVETRFLNQYFVKTRLFAHKLYHDLDWTGLSWPTHVKKAQKNWIGKVNGGYATFRFRKEKIQIFLEENIEMVSGKGCIVVSPTNEIVLQEMSSEKQKDWNEISKKLIDCSRYYGYETGLNVSISESISIPIIISPFLVHHHNDFLYWSKDSLQAEWKKFVESNISNLKLGTNDKDIIKIQSLDEFKRGEWYGLRDWVVSRQRKWGTPIPMINCNQCGSVPIHEHDLPLTREKIESSCSVTCPKCGDGNAEYESDTLDTFFDSSWYYLRFLDPSNRSHPCEKKLQKRVDIYIGGREHATLHLLYARLFCKSLVFMGILDETVFEKGEPFIQFLDVGVVQSLSFFDGKTYVEPLNGVKMGIKGRFEKMGKSKLNGIDPLTLVAEYGSDALRFYMISKTKVGTDFEWNVSGITGAVKYIDKIKMIAEKVGLEDGTTYKEKFLMDDFSQQEITLIKEHDRMIRSIERDLEKCSLHTITSHLFKFTNLLFTHLKSGNEMSNWIEKRCATSLMILSYPIITETCNNLGVEFDSHCFPKPILDS